MQVGVNVKFMHTNFGGGCFSSFGDFAPFLFAFKVDNFEVCTSHARSVFLQYTIQIYKLF